jgi:hypothetical protein
VRVVVVVVAAANWINPHSDFDRLAELVKATDLDLTRRIFPAYHERFSTSSPAMASRSGLLSPASANSSLPTERETSGVGSRAVTVACRRLKQKAVLANRRSWG